MSTSHNFLPADGKVAGLIRQQDWASTPLGDPALWTPALRMMVQFMLGSPLPLMLWWGPENIQIYNDHFIPLLGSRHPHQALGIPASECWRGTPLDPRSALEALSQDPAATRMDEVRIVITRQAAPDADPLPAESHFAFRFSAVPDDAAIDSAINGGVGGVLVTALAVTERAAERDQDRVAALEEKLRESEHRQEQFLGMLAHELRNPLAPIRNGLQLLKMVGDDVDAATRIYGMLERQVNQMVDLVDDLLDVSRITRGKVILRKQAVDLGSIIQTAMRASRPLIDAAHHRLTLELPEELLMLDADSLRFTQVITNLLNNAAKYTDEGGEIFLSVTRQGNDAIISVRDTGMGIPESMLPRIFDLYTEIERTANRAQGGLGVGLSLVRSLVELHGGSVEVRSEGRGKGSEFLIRVPLLTGAMETSSDEQRTPPSPTDAPHHILIVDDNRDAANSLGMLLRLLGADVRIVHDGVAALETLDTWQPDVVLLDIGMPGMDGYELARRIRQQAHSDALNLVALTGWGQDEDRRQSRNSGIDHHLVKPVDIGVLEKLLATLRTVRINGDRRARR